MQILLTLKRDVLALTYCKFKGHVIRRDVLNTLDQKDGQQTVCERCHYPVWVHLDPDDHKYYFVSEDEIN